MEKNIQKYMALVRAVECGSFTKAAAVLNYSQSGISRMIGDLEEEWGVVLLERGHSGVRLTSEGSRLLPFAKSVCSEYERLVEQVEELCELKSGLIRIGTFSSVATHWLPNIVKVFQKDYPNIDYEFLLGDYTEIEEWVSEGRVDCGFLRLPSRPEFDSFLLEQDRLMVVLPLNHPLSRCERFPVAALAESPFMLLEKGAKAEISEIFERYGITPKVRFTTWDDYAIMSMIESGLGISILPELILRRIPYRVTAKELEVPAFRKIGIVVRNAETASLAVKRFMDYLEFRNGDELLPTSRDIVL